MTTPIKRLALVCLVALLEATYVSSTTAFNLPGFGGGRKLLYRFNGNKFAPKVAATQEGMDTRLDYGAPSSNLPYHVDPLSPFTMTSLDKAKGQETVFDIQIDYAPIKTHPSDSGVASSKTNVGSHSHHLPYPSPVPNYQDYLPLHKNSGGVTSSKAVGSHSHHHHLPYPSPVPNYQDYPPLHKNPGGVASSKAVGSHSHHHLPYPSPVPNYQDYLPVYKNPSHVASSKTASVHTPLH